MNPEAIADLSWPLWTREQTARVWGVSVETVSKWDDAGRLTSVRDGSHILRYPSREVCQDILAHTLLSKPQSPVALLRPVKIDPEQFEELCRRLDRVAEVLAENRKAA